MVAARPLADRFWEKVDKTPGHGPHGDCWVWTASANERGYGRIGYGALSDKSKKRPALMRANRVSYELHFGEIPKGLDVLHKCDNPPCVNPNHLELGNHQQNMQDMTHRGRNVPRGRHLRPADVVEIKSLLEAGERTSVIARKFDVGDSTISNIKSGRVWKHWA